VTLSSSVAPTADILPFTTTITIGVTAGLARAANGALQTLSISLAAGAPGVIIEVPSVVATFLIGFPVPGS
jgi:hypothetical protein